jgi:phosphoribosylformylglycinamidine synthase
LQQERDAGEFLRRCVAQGRVSAVHDISDGGLIVALAEMALASGIGAEVFFDCGPKELIGWAFGEDQGRYVVTAPGDADVAVLGVSADFEIEWIGRTGGSSVSIAPLATKYYIGSVPLAALRAAHEGFFPALMQGEL